VIGKCTMALYAKQSQIIVLLVAVFPTICENIASY
jgi:hypothetical protein